MGLAPVIDLLDALGVKYSFGFVVFFVASAIAVYYHDRPRVRQGWTALFVLMLFVPVVVGSNWPFLAWGLFSQPGSTEVTEHVTFVVETDGDLVRYDTRALGPVTAAVFRGYAERMATSWDESTVERFGEFVISRANDYRSRIRGSYGFSPKFWWPNGLRFPRHQLDYRWPRSVVQSEDTFVGVVIYRVHARIIHDGRAIESVTCTPVTSVAGSGVDPASVPDPPETPPFRVCER